MILRAIALALVALTVAGPAAEAACPWGTKYQCRPTYQGKMACGCY